MFGDLADDVRVAGRGTEASCEDSAPPDGTSTTAGLGTAWRLSRPCGATRQFSVRIKYDFFVEKRADNAVASVSTGGNGVNATFFKVPRDPAREFPWREAELVPELNRRLAPRHVSTEDIRHRPPYLRAWVAVQ